MQIFLPTIPSSNEMYQCQYCNNEYQHKRSCNRHIADKHPGKKPMPKKPRQKMSEIDRQIKTLIISYKSKRISDQLYRSRQKGNRYVLFITDIELEKQVVDLFKPRDFKKRKNKEKKSTTKPLQSSEKPLRTTSSTVKKHTRGPSIKNKYKLDRIRAYNNEILNSVLEVNSDDEYDEY